MSGLGVPSADYRTAIEYASAGAVCRNDSGRIMLSININCKYIMMFKNTQSMSSRPEPPIGQTARKEGLMTALPLDLLIALSPLIALGILSLIGK